jgi:FlaG protein
MDVGSPIRQTAPAPLPAQFQSAPVSGQVATVLPKPQAVEAVVDPQAVRVDINSSVERRARLEAELGARKKQFTFDEITKDMIIQTLDSETGEVVAQYPDDWQLKQRAYARAMLERQFENQGVIDRAGAFGAPVERVA